MKYSTDNKKVAWGLIAIAVLDVLVLGTIGEQLEANGQTFILTLMLLKFTAVGVGAAHFFVESSPYPKHSPKGKPHS